MLSSVTNQCNTRLSRIQCLSGNQLKMIAAVCMLIDHVTKVFYSRWINPLLEMDFMTPELHHWIRGAYMVLISIGAVAFPIFAFAFAEGYAHTHDKKRYLLRLAIFALISEIPFDITFCYQGGPEGWAPEISKYWPMDWGYQNVFFTYLCALCTLWVLEQTGRIKQKPLKLLLQGLIVLVAYVFSEDILRSDYGGYGVVLILTAYALRKNRLAQIAGMTVVNLLLYENFTVVLAWFRVSFVVSLLLILLYNGKRGEKNLKLFFYSFYPIHIAIIGFLDWLIFTALRGT